MTLTLKQPTWIERVFGLTDMVVDVPEWDGKGSGYLIDAEIPDGRLMQYPLTLDGKVVRQALVHTTDRLVERMAELKEGDALTTAYTQAIGELVDVYEACNLQVPPKLLALNATVNRATSVDAIYWSVYELLQVKSMQMGQLYQLADLVEDDGRLVAIYSIEGVYHTAEVITDGANVTLGEAMPLDLGGANTTRTFHTTDADGRVRFVSISATSSLNRDGEIDSSSLFSNIERRWHEGGDPELTLDFHHFGEKARLGSVDYVKAEKNTLVISWKLDDTAVGRAAEASVLADPDYWGHSIEYYPLANEVDWVDGKPVLVYHDGFLVRVALCAENKGASLFTKVVTRSVNMSIKQDLEKLLGGNAELVERFLTELEKTNKAVESTVFRAKEEAEAPAENVERAVVKTTEEVETTMSTQVVELDDDTHRLIAEAVLNDERFTEMVDMKVQARLSEMAASIQASLEGVAANAVATAISGQVVRMEKVEDAVRRLSDLPASTSAQRNALRVTTRASQVGQAEQPAKETPEQEAVTLAEIAANSLSKLPKVAGY